MLNLLSSVAPTSQATTQQVEQAVRNVTNDWTDPKIVIGAIFGGLLLLLQWYMSHRLAHSVPVDPKTNTTPTPAEKPPIKPPLVLIFVPLLLPVFMLGCATNPFASILPGNEPFVVNTERAVGAAFDVVDTTVKFDSRNLAFMRDRLPIVHEEIQDLRRTYPPLHRAVRAALAEYKRTRTPEAADAVSGALLAIQAKANIAQEALATATKAKAAAATAGTGTPIAAPTSAPTPASAPDPRDMGGPDGSVPTSLRYLGADRDGALAGQSGTAWWAGIASGRGRYHRFDHPVPQAA